MSADKLSTWKEIALYLGVDAKTAQRWEKLRGLPVSRVPGGLRGQVYATRAEIDTWLRSSQVENREGADQDAVRVVLRLTRTPAVRVAIVCVVLAAAAAYFYWRAPAREPVAQAEIVGNFLVARDKYSHELWRYEFPAVPISRPQPHLGWTDVVFPFSWNAGGQPDVIALVRLEMWPNAEYVLVCFDPVGRMRWQWKPRLDLQDHYGAKFEDYWTVTQILRGNVAGKGLLWLAVANPNRWASAVFEIGSTGARTIRFANAGSVQAIAQTAPGSPELIAAGIHNGFDRPFVALVNLNGAPAFSPPGGPEHYTFRDGPTGLPRRYLLLPNSDVAAAMGLPYLHVADIAVRDHQAIVTLTSLGVERSVINYLFDLNLNPVMVRPTGALPTVHQDLELSGKLKHKYVDCPDLTSPRKFRDWTPATGWRSLDVPVVEPKIAGRAAIGSQSPRAHSDGFSR